MNWVDIIIIAVIVINLIEGMSKGFIFSIFNLTGIIVSAYIAKIYYPILTGYIYNNPNILEKLKKFIFERVFAVIEKEPTVQDNASVLELFKIPEIVKKGLLESFQTQVSTNDLVYSTGSMISETLTRLFINIISIILVFLVARFLLILVVNILNSIAQLPILKQLNRLTGLIFGLLKGVLIIFIIFAVLTPVITLYPDGIMAKGTSESVLGQYFYTNNIIIKLLSEKRFII